MTSEPSVTATTMDARDRFGKAGKSASALAADAVTEAGSDAERDGATASFDLRVDGGIAGGRFEGVRRTVGGWAAAGGAGGAWSPAPGGVGCAGCVPSV